MKNLMSASGHAISGLYRYGFQSPHTLGGRRNPSEDRWRKMNGSMSLFLNAGLIHMFLIDGWADVDPIIAHLRETQARLEPWTAALISDNRSRQELSIFAFSNEAEAVRVRLLIDG